MANQKLVLLVTSPEFVPPGPNFLEPRSLKNFLQYALNNRIYVQVLQLEIGLLTFRELASVVSNWQSSDLQSTIFALHHRHNCCVDGETLVPTADRFFFV